MGRQLRHWTKKVRQPFGAPTSGVRATGATTPGDDDFQAGPVQAWFTQLVKATQGIKQGTRPGGRRKPPVTPKPSITPSAKKKLKFTAEVSSAESYRFQRTLEQDLGIHPVNVWIPSRNRSSAVSERKQPVQPKRKAKVWPRKPWIGNRGKPRDETDPETPCGAPIPATTTTTVATRGQVI